MIRAAADVLVLGSGFAGSLTALLLQRLGRSVVLVDREAHPRFAIGESSTPLADLTLRSLARHYDLPQFLPLTRYGDWKRTYPQIVCGPKRGFSYFLQRPGEEFSTDAAHGRELLVAASSSAELSDTHWLRSDVDAFFAAEAVRAGIPLVERVDLRPASRSPWVWAGARAGEPVHVTARFVIDATGAAGVAARAVGAVLQTDGFQTHSRTLFAHVRGLTRWESCLAGRSIPRDDYPFPCDDAALHHLLSEGWMWQLRFDNGVTSVGFVLESDPLDVPPADEWQTLLQRYPALQQQFTAAEIVAPPQGLRSTGRLQRRWVPAAGPDWVLLPSTAGFIDPLHSTGIAHSLFGVRRLVHLLERHWGRESLEAALADYDRAVQQELTLIDDLVAAAYAARHEFAVFVAAAALYFTAVTTCERRCLEGEVPAFLAADDAALADVLRCLSRQIITAARRGAACAPELIATVRAAIRPWNRVGLLDPAARNMYHHTAPPLP
jgi:FADH2 O2-dependent halogenase